MKNSYIAIGETLKKRIIENQYTDKIPDERSLCEEFKVTRNTIKKAILLLINEGLIINNPGSGNFINQFIKRNFESYENQLKGRIGLSNIYNYNKHKITSKILNFDIIKVPSEIKNELLLSEEEFVYEIERVRYLDKEPFSIELSYIPVKFLPTLTRSVLKSSLYKFVKENYPLKFSNSFITFNVDIAKEKDVENLILDKGDPVILINEIVVLTNGKPFQVSKVRQHYKKFTFHYMYKH